MKKIFAAAAAAVVVLVLAATPSNAHIESGHTEDCEGISLSLDWFPEGVSVITLTGEETIQKELVGPKGTVTATWAELGFDEDTPGASWSYTATWDIHGGGSAGPFQFNVKGCAPETPAVTEPPVVDTIPEPEPTPEESTSVVETEIIPPISEERPPVVETEVTPVVPMLPHTGVDTSTLVILTLGGIALISLGTAMLLAPRSKRLAPQEVKQDQ